MQLPETYAIYHIQPNKTSPTGYQRYPSLQLNLPSFERILQVFFEALPETLTYIVSQKRLFPDLVMPEHLQEMSGIVLSFFNNKILKTFKVLDSTTYMQPKQLYDSMILPNMAPPHQTTKMLKGHGGIFQRKRYDLLPNRVSNSSYLTA